MEPVMKASRSVRRRIELSGYTLMELLVVMAILGILISLVVPTLSVVNSTKLTQAGQIVADQISLARQIASSRNRNVEVRLIQRDADVPGYVAIQLWIAGAPQSAALPAGRLESLPVGTVISKDATLLSRLLQAATTGTMTANSLTANAPYSGFDISPSGLVCSGNNPLANNGDVYLTVVPSRSVNATTPPPNFVTVQINPLTGIPRIYRP